MNQAPRFRGAARLLRGAALGIAAVLITVIGHSAGRGATPEAGLLLLLLPLALALGALVADKRRSGMWILGFVLALQVLFHLLLTIAAGHGHHGSVLPDAPMLIGHLSAALAVAVVLTHGDALVHRWIAFWQALTHDITWTPLPTVPSSAPILVEPTPRASSTLANSIARRGPPVS